MAMVISVMQYSRILKTIDWGCFAAFIFGGAVVALGFLLGFEVNKTFVGLAVVLGWLAVAIATMVFIFTSFIWLIGRADWYWESLSPLNFSFVILVISLFSYNKDVGFLTPALIVVSSLFIAWLLSSIKIHERKPFVFVVVLSFLSVFGYIVPLFIGTLFLFVSIFARRGLASEM
ncbi:MAG: hypothetical protein JAY82_10975 [Candidatus Thiodiazotropha taylori]|nr:hypothetical protein [Candidatus Thiodiazotropha taylori]